MKVHVYTFRNENHFLRWDYGQDPFVEYEAFLELGIDGFFTDFPGSLRRFLEAQTLELRATQLLRTEQSAAEPEVDLLLEWPQKLPSPTVNAPSTSGSGHWWHPFKSAIFGGVKMWLSTVKPLASVSAACVICVAVAWYATMA